jgi:hypothetical protein
MRIRRKCSIRERLYTLEDDRVDFPGHGEQTTRVRPGQRVAIQDQDACHTCTVLSLLAEAIICAVGDQYAAHMVLVW